MQQVNTIQGDPTRSLRAKLGMTGVTGQSGMAGQMGDGFDMIFQNMLAGGLEGEDNLAAMLMQLTGGLQKDSEKWGAQMAAEMLNTVPTLNPAVMAALVEASWGADGQNLAQMVARLQDLQNAGDLANLRGADGMADLLAEDRGITEVLEELVMPEDKTEAGNQNQDFLEVLSAAWAKPKAETRTVSTQIDHSSIRAAKELMQRDKKENIQPLLDVESLQADVDSRRFAPVTSGASLEEQLQVPDGEELADQVKAGIFQNVSQGKNEFVVRIKPEGIGEITVKLSEAKDRISLTIVAANEQTAKLISNEVLALQNALRPLNAEVQEITTAAVAASEQSTQYSAQNQMTDQGRQSHSQQESDRSGRGRRVGGVGGADDSFEETVESGAAANDEILDTYI